MKLLGLYKKMPKSKWQEITKIIKERGVVCIYPVFVIRKNKPSTVEKAIIQLTEKESGYHYGMSGNTHILDAKLSKAYKADIAVVDKHLSLYRL